VGDREIDYSHPSSLRIPRYLATVEAHHKFNPVPRKTVAIDRDFIVNLLGFIPLGMLLICLSGGSLSVMAATALCACLSLTIEVGQLFFAGRVTETADLLLNTLGAGLGAWIATRASSCTNPKLGAKKQ
jgi:glycopeptide antibiotics resistance protein